MEFWLEYTIKHYDRLIIDFLNHLQIVGMALVFSIPLAVLITFMTSLHKKLANKRDFRESWYGQISQV